MRERGAASTHTAAIPLNGAGAAEARGAGEGAGEAGNEDGAAGGEAGAGADAAAEPSGPVRSVAFSPDVQHIISGSYDGIIKVWGRESGACAQTLEGHGINDRCGDV